MRAARLAVVLLAWLAACETPPPETFATGASTRTLSGAPAGTNARGETCTIMPGPKPQADAPVLRSQELYCGGWTQPAARIVQLQAPGDGASLARLASGGLWRRWVDGRAACDAQPEQIRLDGGRPALLLRCTRRVGGWPHLAVVTTGPSGGPVLADGLTTSLPAIERQVAGGIAPTATTRVAGRSDAMQLAIARLAAEAYGTADIARYDQLMALGRELNQAEAFAGAEEAYRAALAIQQRVLGADNPNTVAPMLALALNLSNQGRDARFLFATAARLAPRAADPTAVARLAHYRGIDLLNRGDPATALRELEQAEALYTRAAPVAVAAVQALPTNDAGGEDLILDAISQSAVLGLSEARRFRGVALARLGRGEESVVASGESRSLLRKAGLEPGLIVGRGLRSLGGAVDAAGRPGDATSLFTASAARFAVALPGERPEAVTLYAAGARQLENGRRGEALDSFRAGERILRARQIGLPVAAIMPQLEALAAEAAARPGQAAALQVEMFAASQSARRDTTTRLSAQAAARLGAAGGDKRVGEAVRRMQDSDRALRSLLSARDLGDAPGRTANAEIDRRIAEAQQARAEAESEVAAAAPGYRQLMQAVAGADAVAAALGPDEVLVSMLLGPEHGYVFAVRGGSGAVLARRVGLSETQAQDLVKRVRAGIELGTDGVPGRFDTQAAQTLYELLLAPLAPALEGARTVLVAADGPLLSIPFGLLLTGRTTPDNLAAAPWLIRRHAIVHMPAAQTLVALRGAGSGVASAAPLAYAGFGDPVMPTEMQLRRSFPPDRCAGDARAARELRPLPGTRVEVLAAQRLTGARPEAVKLGSAFTAAAIRGGGLERYRVVHFATHALLPGELSCLQEPALMASTPAGAADANGAFIPTSAFLALKLDADLVILSACNTGTVLGGEATSGTGGEGLSAMARGFFFAGARGVLATHWSVNDEAAELTVTIALKRQAEHGASSAVALRTAQLALLDEAGKRLPAAYAHPFFWAPFALIGDGRRDAARG